MARPPADPDAPITADQVARELHLLIDELVAAEADATALHTIQGHIDDARGELAEHPRSRYWERDGAADYRQLSPYRGPANPVAPPMVITSTGSGTEARFVGDVHVPAMYEGPPKCVHGGFLAGLFDEIMGATQAAAPGGAGLTGRLVVRYRRPTPIDTPLRFTSWIERTSKSFTSVAAQCHNGEQLTAEATGLFMAPRPATNAASTSNAASTTEEGSTSL